jgi:hypothetical protein
LPQSSLCPGDPTDTNGNGIPDSCDPCSGPSAPAGCADLGTSVGGLPNHAERVWMIALNAVRADPLGYKATYMVFGDATDVNVFATSTAAVPAMALSRTGNQGGHLHATNRVMCTPASTAVTNLCDGTPYATWSAPYQPISVPYWYSLGPDSWTGELPIRVFGAILCGGSIQSGTYAVFTCKTDGSRDVFVGTSHTQFGPGEGYNDAMQYSVWDMLDSDQAVPFAFPAPSDGHFLFGTEIHFALNVDATAPPKAVYLYVDGTQLAMTPALGTSSRGMYRVVQPAGTTCRNYYMILVDAAGQLWRYPALGFLVTNGEAACEDWVAN